MSLTEPEQKIGNYLRQFRPLAPGPLRRQEFSRRWVLIPVAAVLITGAVAATYFWSKVPQRTIQGTTLGFEAPKPQPSVTLGSLNIAFAKSDADLDQFLGAASAEILRPARKGSALTVLSKEEK